MIIISNLFNGISTIHYHRISNIILTLVQSNRYVVSIGHAPAQTKTPSPLDINLQQYPISQLGHYLFMLPENRKQRSNFLFLNSIHTISHTLGQGRSLISSFSIPISHQTFVPNFTILSDSLYSNCCLCRFLVSYGLRG